MATLSGGGGLFDFSSLFQNLGDTGGISLFGFGTGLSGGLDLTGGLGGGFDLTGSLSGPGLGLDFTSLFGGPTGGFSLDLTGLFGGTTTDLFSSFGTTGTTLDFSSLFGSGGTTFNFFA